MSILGAGNLISKLSLSLPPRRLSLSWLKRSNIRCYAQNTNGSGFPVRYVPKKRPDVKQTQSPSSGDDSPKNGKLSSSDTNQRVHKTLDATKHAQGGSNVGKCSNITTRKSLTRSSRDAAHEFNEGSSHGFGVRDTEGKKAPEDICYDNGAVNTEYMKVPKELVQESPISKGGGRGECYYDEVMDAEFMDFPEEDDEESQTYEGSGQGKQARSKACRTKHGAEKLAVELLAKRAFTAVELQKKLSAKHFPPNIVQAVIRDFRNRGLINDSLYAETFSQSRWTSSSWGPRRIKQALLKKGVSEVDVEKAVKWVFEDGEESDRNSSMRISNTSVEKLYLQASKQWQRSQNVAHETRKARVIRWLQYRGFDWGVVSIILKKLESEHPP